MTWMDVLDFVILAVSIALITKGADWFTSASVKMLAQPISQKLL